MYLKRELNIGLLKKFPKIGKSETDRKLFMRSFSPFSQIGTTIYYTVSTFLWKPYCVHGPC